MYIFRLGKLVGVQLTVKLLLMLILQSVLPKYITLEEIALLPVC